MTRAPLLPYDYDAIATMLKAPLCPPQCAMRDLSGHHRGFADVTQVHWKRRAPVRRGIWTFLKLVVSQRLGTFGMRTVERLWLENTEAYYLGLEIGLRFPREFADLDRARVRAELANTDLAIEKEMRVKIERWARADG